ncbi:PEP-CTERM protein-sorting domain [Comamonadaceae bacterium]
MKIKSILSAAALVAMSASSFAGTFTTSFDSEGFASIFKTYSKSTGGSFNDTWNFSGATAGTYQVEGSISGSGLSFTSISMDGTPWTLVSNGSVTNFAELVNYVGAAPLSMTIVGSKSATGSSFYSGGVTVTPVPEPETYAMLLAGLGVMGAIARRRKQAA